jgi:hypothetical protein
LETTRICHPWVGMISLLIVIWCCAAILSTVWNNSTNCGALAWWMYDQDIFRNYALTMINFLL